MIYFRMKQFLDTLWKIAVGICILADVVVVANAFYRDFAVWWAVAAVIVVFRWGLGFRSLIRNLIW